MKQAPKVHYYTDHSFHEHMIDNRIYAYRFYIVRPGRTRKLTGSILKRIEQLFLRLHFEVARNDLVGRS